MAISIISWKVHSQPLVCTRVPKKLVVDYNQFIKRSIIQTISVTLRTTITSHHFCTSFVCVTNLSA